LGAMEKYPRSSEELSDLKAACRKFVLPGFVPESPFLTKSDVVMTQGSCFAENLSIALLGRGHRVVHVGFTEAFNAPAINAIILQYIAHETPCLLPDHEQAISQTILADYRVALRSAKLVIFTLGVAFYPQQRGIAAATGDWYWPSFGDVTRQVDEMISNVRHVNRSCEIVLTVSPVPLNRSITNEAPVVADARSKSLLRSVAQTFIDSKKARYWPAFEIVRWLGAHRPGHYGADDGLQRHVSRNVVDVVTELFVESFFISP